MLAVRHQYPTHFAHDVIHDDSWSQDSRQRRPSRRDPYFANAQPLPRTHQQKHSPSIHIDISNEPFDSHPTDDNHYDFWDSVSQSTGNSKILDFANYGASFLFKKMAYEDHHRGRSRRRRDDREPRYEERDEESPLALQYYQDDDTQSHDEYNNTYYQEPRYSKSYHRPSEDNYCETSPSRFSPPPRRADYGKFSSYAGREDQLPEGQRKVIDTIIQHASIVREHIIDIATEIYPDGDLMCQVIEHGPSRCVAALWQGNADEGLERETDITKAVACGIPCRKPCDAMEQLNHEVQKQVEQERTRQEGRRRVEWLRGRNRELERDLEREPRYYR